MAVSFYLHNRATRKPEVPIQVSISICGVRLVTSLGYNIEPAKWDNKKQKIKQGANNSKGFTYSEINSRIAEITAAFNRLESEIKLNQLIITKELITSIWQEKFKINTKKTILNTKKSEENAFLACFDEFVAKQSIANRWTISTLKKMNTTRLHICQFCKEPTFSTFDKNGLDSYINFLQSKQQLIDTTTKKYLGLLKWFLRWALANDYPVNRDFEKFKPKFKIIDTKIVFLNWNELMTVYNFPIPKNKEYLQRVRDVFCFCCFTSLRYSDVANLKRSDIINNTLHITTVKTANTLQIELNNYSRSILEKYKNIPYENNKALPVISNQKMNDYLKELGQICELNEPITQVYFRGAKRFEEVYPKYELLGTHAGRRTFICNALALGIPAQVVMKWTGHSDYAAMKPYIDIADNIKAEQMNKFNNI